jgi:hypothetical protein
MIRDGKGSDDTYIDIGVMKSMGWSWEDLYNVPERTFLSISRIMSLQAKHDAAEREKAKQARKGMKGMGVK